MPFAPRMILWYSALAIMRMDGLGHIMAAHLPAGDCHIIFRVAAGLSLGELVGRAYWLRLRYDDLWFMGDILFDSISQWEAGVGAAGSCLAGEIRRAMAMNYPEDCVPAQLDAVIFQHSGGNLGCR